MFVGAAALYIDYEQYDSDEGCMCCISALLFPPDDSMNVPPPPCTSPLLHIVGEGYVVIRNHLLTRWPLFITGKTFLTINGNLGLGLFANNIHLCLSYLACVRG